MPANETKNNKKAANKDDKEAIISATIEYFESTNNVGAKISDDILPYLQKQGLDISSGRGGSTTVSNYLRECPSFEQLPKNVKSQTAKWKLAA